MKKDRMILCREPETKRTFLLPGSLCPGQQGRDGLIYLGEKLYKPASASSAADAWQAMVLADSPAVKTDRWGVTPPKAKPKSDIEVNMVEYQALRAAFTRSFDMALRKQADKKQKENQEKERKREAAARAGRENFTSHPANPEFRWCRHHEVYEYIPIEEAVQARLREFEGLLTAHTFGMMTEICCSDLRRLAGTRQPLPANILALAPTAPAPDPHVTITVTTASASTLEVSATSPPRRPRRAR